MTKLPAITKELTAFAAGDLVYGVDISDTTEHTSGSSFKAQYDNLRNEILKTHVITPQMHGAVGDATTDDSTAVQDASDACDALNTPNIVKPVLYFPYARGYRCNSTITIKENINVVMETAIIHNGSQSTAGLVIGTTKINNVEVNLRLYVERLTTSDWTNEGSIGIKLFCCDACDIFVSVKDFTIGLQCMGSGLGFGWNHVFLQRMVNNKFQVDLTNVSDSGIGWVNENTFFGGRFAHITGTRTGLSRYGFRVRSQDSSPNYNNSNLFIQCSMELRQADASPGEAVPYLIQHGQQHHTFGGRNETNHADFAICQNNSKENSFGHTFNRGTIRQEDTATENVAEFQGDSINDGTFRMVFDSGSMHKRACMYNSTNIHIPGVHLGTSADATNSVSTAETAIDIFANETFTVDTATDELIDTAHSRENGDVVFLTTTATLPIGLSTGTKYYVVEKTTDRFKVSTTLSGSAVDITGGTTDTDTYHSPNRWILTGTARSVGVKLDTQQAKQFVIVNDSESGNGGRRRIHAHDSEGVLLLNDADFTTNFPTDELIVVAHSLVVDDRVTVSSDTTLPAGLAAATTYFVISITTDRFKVSLTKGGASVTITDNGSGTHTYSLTDQYVLGTSTYAWNTTYGGHYATTTDSNADAYFRLRPEVKSVNVAMSGGTSQIKLRRFTIFGIDIDYLPATSVDYDFAAEGENVGTEAPTSGVWGVGRFVRNHAPAVREAAGWLNSVEGAPGTWLTLSGMPLDVSASVDPANIIDGAELTISVSATGAALGDFVQFSAPYDLEDLTVTAYVQAADTIELRLENQSGTARDLDSGTWKFRITQPPT